MSFIQTIIAVTMGITESVVPPGFWPKGKSQDIAGPFIPTGSWELNSGLDNWELNSGLGDWETNA